jgi:phospholipid/cholesterol/gamma-HCH transport system permease protein
MRDNETPDASSPASPPRAGATLARTAPGEWQLGGAWTLQSLGAGRRAVPPPSPTGDEQPTLLDGSALTAMDSVGAWVLQNRLGGGAPAVPGVGPAAAPAVDVAAGTTPRLLGWPEHALTLMHEVRAGATQPLAQPPRRGVLQRIGGGTVAGGQQALAFVAFVGELALAATRALRQPSRWRASTFRRVLREIEIGGFDALPIIGLTAFLLGVVVAYQGADQLRHYGANVFVVELVGYAMLREFAPLIAAIIVAGRSGSAYAAQIGTMVVNDEVDAMRTLGIDPLQRLVLPRIVGLAVALPLLTVFADVAGVFGGMVMASTQLGIGFAEFADRFGRVIPLSAFLIGVGKSLVFALIIVLVGCFHGLRAGQGGADSVGRQTTLSVVQAIFLVIVVDALFSVAFNLLGL